MLTNCYKMAYKNSPLKWVVTIQKVYRVMSDTKGVDMKNLVESAKEVTNSKNGLMKELIMETKKCIKCGIEKTVDNFSKHKDEYQSYCKACTKITNKAYKGVHREEAREYAKKYYKGHTEKYKIYNKEYKINNKEKANAHSIVSKAVKDGNLIIPATCSCCGKDCKPEGHHEDYSKPLEVTWLCRSCHKYLHADAMTILTKSTLDIVCINKDTQTEEITMNTQEERIMQLSKEAITRIFTVEEAPEDSLDAMLFRQAFREGFALAKENPNANIDELIEASSTYIEILKENA